MRLNCSSINSFSRKFALAKKLARYETDACRTTCAFDGFSNIFQQILTNSTLNRYKGKTFVMVLKTNFAGSNISNLNVRKLKVSQEIKKMNFVRKSNHFSGKDCFALKNQINPFVRSTKILIVPKKSKAKLLYTPCLLALLPRVNLVSLLRCIYAQYTYNTFRS